MNIAKAYSLILKNCSNTAACFFTNGYSSRIGFSVKDRPLNFYMIGSMGLVSSVALGAALNSKGKAIIFDGDGSVLMNMGVMPLIGYEKPNNLLHIIFDNGVYASTGNQDTISKSVDFCRIAKSVGYKNAFAFKSMYWLKKGLKNILNAKGPVLLHLIVEPKIGIVPGRINLTPPKLTARMKKALSVNI